MSERIRIQPYFVPGERYPSLIGVAAGDDEYETAYVSKAELVAALDENAKLREVLHDALRPRYDRTLKMTPREWDAYDEDVLRRTRELGMEVDK